MLPPPPRVFGALALSEVKRTGNVLACPTCGDGMKPTTIHEVELDHCVKHGVWFDVDELRITLYRVALPSNPPPFREWEPAPELPRRPLPPPVAQAKPRPFDPTVRRVVFEVAGERFGFEQPVIKIGRGPTSTLRIEDENVSRLHAVIEVTATEVLLIDLGSALGTLVNGERATKWALQSGDVLRFGTTDVTIFIGGHASPQR